MDATTQSNEPEELAIKAPTDNSLPAAQVLAEQVEEADESFAPRYIP